MVWLEVLILCIAARCSTPFNVDLEHVWNAYRDVYPKPHDDYAGKDSERWLKLRRNSEMVVRHNIEADLGRHTYWFGLNVFSDMTDEELVRNRNSALADEEKNSSKAMYSSPTSAVELPEEFDNRVLGLVTSVKNQGHCSSCYAFSAVGALEGQWAKYKNDLKNLSVQNIVDCSKKYGCYKGLMWQVYEYIIKIGGIDTDNSYPYLSMNGPCRFNSSNIGATANSYFYVEPWNETLLKEAVFLVGPISIAINQTALDNYRNGVFDPEHCSAKVDHAVLVVGYGFDESTGTPYWLIKNSYGTSWGDNGYLRLVRNKRNGMCGITRIPNYPVVG